MHRHKSCKVIVVVDTGRYIDYHSIKSNGSYYLHLT